MVVTAGSGRGARCGAAPKRATMPAVMNAGDECEYMGWKLVRGGRSTTVVAGRRLKGR
jgi:hypothetical protein